MKKILIMAALMATAWLGSVAEEIRWHDVGDKSRIERLLASVEPGRSASDYVLQFAEAFEGVPYVGSTLEGETECLTIDLDRLDCTTFVETVAALSLTVADRRTTWPDYANTLRALRYRGGRIDGYASRHHYMSDWALENIQRGVVEDVTPTLSGAEYMTKTLDYMTRHREAYPALADSGAFASLRHVEAGFRGHRYPIIKTARLTKATLKGLRDGDIVVVLTKAAGLDASHVGFVKMVNGVPHLLHASSKHGKVVVDPLPLTEYLRRNRSVAGIRVLRLKGD